MFEDKQKRHEICSDIDLELIGWKFRDEITNISKMSAEEVSDASEQEVKAIGLDAWPETPYLGNWVNEE